LREAVFQPLSVKELPLPFFMSIVTVFVQPGMMVKKLSE
jgi:hypothetical protein